MNKGELIESVQNALGGEASKKDAEAALSAVLESIANGVRKDDNVQIIGFGTSVYLSGVTPGSMIGHSPDADRTTHP